MKCDEYTRLLFSVKICKFLYELNRERGLILMRWYHVSLTRENLTNVHNGTIASILWSDTITTVLALLTDAVVQ